MVALYFYLIQSRQNILLCKNQNNFFIAVRERQTKPGFGQLNQNILYFCISYIPHNFAPFVRVLWDVGDAVPYGIVAYNPHFSGTLFLLSARLGDYVRQFPLGVGQAARLPRQPRPSFPGVSIVPVTSIMSFFLVIKQNAL